MQGKDLYLIFVVINVSFFMFQNVNDGSVIFIWKYILRLGQFFFREINEQIEMCLNILLVLLNFWLYNVLLFMI